MSKISVLTEAEKKKVHESTLKILEKCGLRIKSKKIQDEMEKHGCTVDREKDMIRFPAETVMKAIDSTAKKFILGGLDPARDMYLGEGNQYLATDGQGCFVNDLETGERRMSNMQDLIDLAVVCDQLDNIRMFWPSVSGLDAPDNVRTLAELTQVYQHSGLHFQSDVYHPAQVPYFIEALEAILGDKEKIRERSIFSVVCCSVSPLSFEPEMMEACIELSGYGVPVLILPMPISGATAPASLLSTVLMNNAEVLAGITVFQAFNPGARILYGSAPSILDMKSALFAVGAPEEGVLNAACVEMGKYYGLPTFGSTMASDAKEAGVQAAMEKAVGGMAVLLADPDILCGIGLLETCQCLHFGQLLIDNEIFGYVKRSKQGINTEDEMMFDDLICEMGPGSEFLTHESTLAGLRKGEFYNTTLANRQAYDIWKESPTRDMLETAKGKAREMIKNSKEYFGADTAAKLAEIVKRASRELVEE